MGDPLRSRSGPGGVGRFASRESVRSQQGDYPPVLPSSSARKAFTERPVSRRMIITATPKGGVGKSFFLINLADWLAEKNMRTLCFDTDWSSGTLTRFQPESRFLTASDEEGHKPLEVDFGCHRGAFLSAMAAMAPERNFLGIEKQSSRVEACNRKFLRLGLANALALRGEGAQALRELLPDRSVITLHVSFPDPWPKRRHARRRAVNPDFLREAARVLAPEGSLRLMTDDPDYFSEMCALTSAGWTRVPWEDGIERPLTTFQKTFLALGKTPCCMALRPTAG